MKRLLYSYLSSSGLHRKPQLESSPFAYATQVSTLFRNSWLKRPGHRCIGFGSDQSGPADHATPVVISKHSRSVLARAGRGYQPICVNEQTLSICHLPVHVMPKSMPTTISGSNDMPISPHYVLNMLQTTRNNMVSQKSTSS